MSIMTQLEFELDFSSSEKELAHYILDNGEKILDYSIQQLALKTYTSPATIVRFCKKLGLQGYLDFKIKYSAELQFDNHELDRIDVNFPFKHNDSYQQIAYKIAQLHQQAIDDTLKLLDFKQLEKSINILSKANRIFVFGNGNSLIAGMSFQHKMLRMGKIVEVTTLPGENRFASYVITPKDVAIMISYSGETIDIIEIAKMLKEKNVPLIGITSIGENQLTTLCRYLLNTGSREKIFNKIAPFSSKTSIEYILDLLFSGLFKLEYHDILNSKVSFDKKYDSRHPKKSPINE